MAILGLNDYVPQAADSFASAMLTLWRCRIFYQKYAHNSCSLCAMLQPDSGIARAPQEADHVERYDGYLSKYSYLALRHKARINSYRERILLAAEAKKARIASEV